MSDQTFTVIGPNQQPMQVTEDMLAGMDQNTLLQMRMLNKDQDIQNTLAKYEHRAFSREYLKENPWMIPSMAVATPLYSAYKALPTSLTGNQSRSPASLSQMGQGLMGIGDAVSDLVIPKFVRN